MLCDHCCVVLGSVYMSPLPSAAGLLGVVFGFLVSFLRDGSTIMKDGFFHGYNNIVILTVVLQVLR